MAVFALYCRVYHLDSDEQDTCRYADIEVNLPEDTSICGCDEYSLQTNTWKNIRSAIKNKKITVKESSNSDLFLSLLDRDGYEFDYELEAIDGKAPDWGNI